VTKLRATAAVALLLITAIPAGAMNGLEFLRVDDSPDATEEMAVMKPLVAKFVDQGYHNVPDWSELAYYTRKLILERGYRDKDVAEIAEEAAIANGMTK
jgi:hypothetical protein